MCGRVDLHTPAQEIALRFAARWSQSTTQFHSAWNIAPARPILAVLDREGERRLEALLWGFVPRWTKAPAKTGPINARAETVAQQPMFRDAFRHARCLVPVDGFYEWKRDGVRKQPWYFRMRDRAPFALAGIWSRWLGRADEAALETAAILTTGANEIMTPVHERMPVIVAQSDWQRWLVGDATAAQSLLAPFPALEMEAFSISSRVNSAANDGPELIEPLADGE